MTHSLRLGHAAVAALLLGAACRDATPVSPLPGEKEPVSYGASVLAVFECSGRPGSPTLSCSDVSARTGDARAAILGQGQIKLRSSNVSYHAPTQIYGFDVTLENLLGEPIGTPDGTTATGSKVFYETGPTITAYVSPGDTGTINVANADGYTSFTGANQPYHFYPQILATNDTSPPRRWELRMPLTVQTFAFTLKVFSARPSEPRVPAAAPDSVPESIYAAANVVTNLPGMSGTYLRDIVTVFFQPTATLDERQAAIDRVGGTVVGGIRIDAGDGLYYVQVPGGATAQPLLDAIDLLDALPQVVGAAPEFIEEVDSVLAYQAPKDSVGVWDQWRLGPDAADGMNWALEAVGAPYAWGCETGSASVRMAVVDHGLHARPDELLPNLGSVHFNPQGGFPTSSEHATMVMSAMAARGNNGAGMTGMMWNATVDVYEIGTNQHGVPTTNAAGGLVLRSGPARLARAISDGASVINVSLSLKWSAAYMAQTLKTGQATVDDHRRVLRHAGGLSSAIEWSGLRGRRPLLVFSAANYGADAYWSGYPVLLDNFPNQVISVAAAGLTAPGQGFQGGRLSRAVTSSYGSRVKIAAPGINVGVIDGTGQVTLASGTSVAAPLVAGAAGLLRSWNPSLTTAQVKEYLIQGAINGGRKIDNGTEPGGVPVLNIHESLKLAARQAGGPLCGNRVWRDGNSIVAQRGSGTEVLFTVPNSTGHIDEIQVLHGGKRIRFDQWTASDRMFQWVNGAWVEQSAPSTEKGASHLSWTGYSHDGTRLAYLDRYSTRVELRIKNLTTGSDSLVQTLPRVRSNTYVDACVRRSTGDTIHAPACSQNMSVGGRFVDEYSYPAFSPDGEWIYLSGYRDEATYHTTGSWYLCPGQDVANLPMNHMECLDTTNRAWYSAGAVYAFSPDGTQSRIVVSEAAAFGPIVAADGLPEIAVQKTVQDLTYQNTWTYDPSRFTPLQLHSTSVAGTQPACVTHYRSATNGAVLSTRAACGSEDITFSSSVAPVAPGPRPAPAPVRRRGAPRGPDRSASGAGRLQ